jgi:hypothetical protein
MYELNDTVRDLRSGKVMIVVTRSRQVNGRTVIGVTDKIREHDWRVNGNPLKFRWSELGLLRAMKIDGIAARKGGGR